MGQRVQTNTFELKAHRKHEIRHQHRHLERDELTPAQSAWPERLVAIPGPSLCTNQGRGGNQERDILNTPTPRCGLCCPRRAVVVRRYSFLSLSRTLLDLRFSVTRKSRCSYGIQ